MQKMEKITYRVKDKGGPSGGQEISFEAPAFDLQDFLKTPNADAFIKKAYQAAAKKIALEVQDKRNGSLPADLTSYEMIVARSLKFTKADISHWLKTRDWSRIDSYKDPASLRKSMEKWLPSLSLRVNHSPEGLSKKIAEKIVAELADNPDPIAEYLFVTLTVDRPQEEIDRSAF